MRRWNAVSPIVFAFICGSRLPDLAWKIDTDPSIHSATDLCLWIIVPMSAGIALHGAWRAFRDAGRAPAPS